MKIELDYLAQLLNVFIEANSAHISISEMEDAGIEIKSKDDARYIDECFFFHLQIALENKLISNRELQPCNHRDVGIHFGNKGDLAIGKITIPLRLTQSGHDFASALANKEVLMKLKSELKDAPFKSIFDGGQKLLTHYAKKKLDKLLSEDAWQGI